MDKYQRMQPRLHMNRDVLEDNVYPTIEIDTPFLTTKTPDAKETHAGKKQVPANRGWIHDRQCQEEPSPEEQVRFGQDHLHAEAN